MSTNIQPSFGQQAVLFNEDTIVEPLQAKGSIEFTQQNSEAKPDAS